MARFIKTCLPCGTFHSPDGQVVITPQRLRTWALNFQRMGQNGYHVPMSWDHADNLEDAVPVKMGADRTVQRSAKNTAGLVKDFRLAKDGNSAEIVIDAEGRAADQARCNRVFLSPVIFPEWKDGQGNTYKDVITHVDFVDHPVDSKQQPFREVAANATPILACAIRMGLTKPIKMGFPNAEDETKKDDASDNVDADDTGAAGDAGGDGVVNEGEPNEQPGDGNEPPADDKPSDPRLEIVAMYLTELGLNLPVINSADELLGFLFREASGAEEPEGGSGNNEGGTEVADPGMQAMSLQRIKDLEAILEKQAKASLTADLEKLLKTGRCTKAEHDAQAVKLGTLRMSVGNDGKAAANDVTAWVESRKAIPLGTFHGGKPITRMGLGKRKAEVADAPLLPAGGASGTVPTEAEAEEMAKSICGY